MENAFKTSTLEAQAPEAHVTSTPADDVFAARELEIVVKKLELCRDVISHVDTSDKASWKRIIAALFSAGFQTAELETELAASPNTLYKWKEGLAAPRELTRKLLRRAILEMVDERIASVRNGS